jgi:ABC-type Fe3+-hydroxamate transport system substrate-binding protein
MPEDRTPRRPPSVPFPLQGGSAPEGGDGGAMELQTEIPCSPSLDAASRPLRPSAVRFAPSPLEGEAYRGKRRIVSLVPCITETLLARGLGDRVAGVTRYCPSVATAEIVGGVWDLDIERITGLSPDLVLADSEEQRRSDLETLEARFPLRILTIRSIADALDFAGRADALAPAPAPPLPVLVPIWLRPLRVVGAGRYGDALLAAAGLENRIQDAGYPAPGGDDLDALDAAVIDGATLLLPTEPWAFDETDATRYRRSMPRLRGVHVVDGRDLFWYGARTQGALARLRMLHSVLFEGGEP